MARDSSGTQNQPGYATTGAPADAADLTEVANYAALVGNRKTGTTIQRNAASGSDVWEGLLWGDTTDDNEYIYQSGWVKLLEDTGWVAVSSLGASWTSTSAGGYRVLSVRRINKVVFINGTATKTSWSAFDTVATLPSGYWPSAQVTGHARHSDTTSSFFDISSTGVIRVGTGGTTNFFINHSFTIL